MATITWNWYPKAIEKMANGDLDLGAASLYIMLLGAGYTPSDAHEYEDDLTNEVEGAGYDAGGKQLTGVSVSLVPAANLTARANGTAYQPGQVRRPAASNGYIYRCVVGGTTGGSEPSWPTTVGATVTDGTATWVCAGKNMLTLKASNPSWASATITAARAVLVDKTPGDLTENPLVGYGVFDAPASSDNGTFAINFDTDGILAAFI